MHTPAGALGNFLLREFRGKRCSIGLEGQDFGRGNVSILVNFQPAKIRGLRRVLLTGARSRGLQQKRAKFCISLAERAPSPVKSP